MWIETAMLDNVGLGEHVRAAHTEGAVRCAGTAGCVSGLAQ